MTGYDVYKKACARLGILGNAEEIVAESGLLTRALELVNQILTDLKIAEIKNLSDEITADTEKSEAICCGVAMLLSLSDGNSEKNQIYTNIYNAKRATVLSHLTLIEDNLPITEGN